MRQRSRRVHRHISHNPEFTYFKPAGVPKRQLDQIALLPDEYEAMRLVDLEDMSMQDGADKMGVSPATFNRMVKSARKKVVDSIVNGKAIQVLTND